MSTAKALMPIDKMSLVVGAQQIRTQFESALRENSGAFIASLIDLYSGDTYLQQCEPRLVAMEALKAATLKLPINKQLGFSYIVPYRKAGKAIPQFQIGYRGYIQLAQRSGLYAAIHATVIPEGLTLKQDWITGDIEISGEPKSQKAQGYLAHFRLLNGFKKTLYMSRSDVGSHAKRYSKSYNAESSAWKTHFDEMAMKTCLRLLLGRYGPMSTEMQMALTHDSEYDDEAFEEDVKEHANRETLRAEEVVDAEFTEKEESPEPENDKASPEEKPPKAAAKPEQLKINRGPGY